MRVVTKTDKTNNKSTRYIYIKISEILGIAKDIGTAAKNLKAMVANGKDTVQSFDANATKKELKKYAIQYSLSMIRSMVDPLIALIKANETYQKIMKIYQISKPIIETVSLATGAWNSPGNVGEIAMIAWGMAQKILTQILLSLYVTVKNLILNYELEIPISSPEVSGAIKNATKEIEKNNGRPETPNPNSNPANNARLTIISEPNQNEFTNQLSFNNIEVGTSGNNEGIKFKEGDGEWTSSNITTGSFKVGCLIKFKEALFAGAYINDNFPGITVGILKTVDGKTWETIKVDEVLMDKKSVDSMRILEETGEIPAKLNIFTSKLEGDEQAYILNSADGTTFEFGNKEDNNSNWR